MKYNRQEGFSLREQVIVPVQRNIRQLRDTQAEEVADILNKERRLAELEDIRSEMEREQFLDQRTKARIISDRRTADEMFFQARPNRFFRLSTLTPFNEPI